MSSCMVTWFTLKNLQKYFQKESYPQGFGFQSTISTSVTWTNYTYAVLETGVLLSLPWDVTLDEISNSLFVFCKFFFKAAVKTDFEYQGMN